eukprot:CCRYP_006669-RA/>CCRYP_006669-RA protein AED:0.36 eAED:0.98 QI:0/0/0/1/0/0/2/0/83
MGSQRYMIKNIEKIFKDFQEEICETKKRPKSWESICPLAHATLPPLHGTTDICGYQCEERYSNGSGIPDSKGEKKQTWMTGER